MVKMKRRRIPRSNPVKNRMIAMLLIALMVLAGIKPYAVAMEAAETTEDIGAETEADEGIIDTESAESDIDTESAGTEEDGIGTESEQNTEGKSAQDTEAESAVEAVSMTSEEALASMQLVAETDSLQLYFDEVEAGIAVYDKASGETWFSNPIDTGKDSISTSYYLKVLKSQVNITYINDSTQVSTMNSYSDAVADGQFEVEYLDNGVKVTYSMGSGAAFLLLPEVITEERMLAFQENMTDDQIRKINRNYTLYVLDELSDSEREEMLASYPLLAEENIYVLRGGVKDYLKEELAEYFEGAGYTEEDLEIDAVEGDAAEDEDPWFTIPVTYELDGDSFTATLNPEEIEYNTNGYYLVNVDVLRYFGASLEDDGYLFVPDGSGALIYFNNGKTTAASYGASVYGQDETSLTMNYYQSQVDAANTVKMPVYGIKDGGKAFLAVIEEGDAYAYMNASVSGTTTGYNNVYASFTYLQYGETSLDDIVGSNSYYMYSKAEFEGNYKLRYYFLTEDDADYSGMAARYRQYLLDNGTLTERLTDENLAFTAEYIGAIDKDKTILGIKYNAVVPLTTFAQATEITDLLRDGGVDNISIVYDGWANGGLHGTAATSLSVVSGLKKGGTTLSDFTKYAGENGLSLFMTLDLQYVYKDKLLDGYSTMQYAPKYFDNTNVTINDYGLASAVSEGTLANLVSPYYVEKITSALTGRLAKKEISGIGLGTISWELYSDLANGTYTDRQMAEAKNSAAVQTLANTYPLIADNANAYIWGYADEIMNVPLYSNGYQIIDEEVPFYEMVLHGYVSYTGEALNLADDYETSLLKCVESGAGLHYQWIYASNSELKETDFDYLYSVNYEAWMETAISDYNRANEAIGKLSGLTITKHEIVQTDVVRVTYEDGTVVLVNYSQEDVTVDGVTVGARDYIVR